MNRVCKHHEEGGFTLVELMMSLVIFAVAVAGILSVAVSLTQGFREQRQAITAQDAVRSPLDIIADALRQASPGVTDPRKVYDANTCTQGAIVVTNSTTASDTLSVIYAAGGVVTTATANVATGSAGSVAVTSNTGLAIGDYVLMTSDFSTGVVVKLTSSTSNTIGWAGNSCGTSYQVTMTAPVTVIRVQHATFFVQNDSTNGNMPTLYMDPDATASTLEEPLAEAVEDLQVVVGVDGNADGALTDAASSTDEWRGNHASDTAFNGASDTGDIARAVRLTMVARTTAIQHGNQNTYSKPTSEDRTAASAADQYRRRVLKTVVEIRNVSGSP